MIGANPRGEALPDAASTWPASPWSSIGSGAGLDLEEVPDDPVRTSAPIAPIGAG